VDPKPDFSGYATKAGLKCSDGRTITPEAFKHMDGKTVPLVWQHGHNEPANVLGHAVLEARDDGMYCHGYFNPSQSAQQAKALVQHKDITSLSIYANQLVERAKQVFHGVIREVSLVLSGANPGALIDNVTVAHGDGTTEELPEEAVIYTGLRLQHSDDSSDVDDFDAAGGSEDDYEDDEVVEHAVQDAEDLKDGGADDVTPRVTRRFRMSTTP
jgi:HK97 family phage prohead protease